MFARLKEQLDLHAEIEEEIFYPALEEPEEGSIEQLARHERTPTDGLLASLLLSFAASRKSSEARLIMKRSGSLTY